MVVVFVLGARRLSQLHTYVTGCFKNSRLDLQLLPPTEPQLNPQFDQS